MSEWKESGPGSEALPPRLRDYRDSARPEVPQLVLERRVGTRSETLGFAALAMFWNGVTWTVLGTHWAHGGWMAFCTLPFVVVHGGFGLALIYITLANAFSRSVVRASSAQLSVAHVPLPRLAKELDTRDPEVRGFALRAGRDGKKPELWVQLATGAERLSAMHPEAALRALGVRLAAHYGVELVDAVGDQVASQADEATPDLSAAGEP